MPNPKKPGTGATNKRRRELAAAKKERQAARRSAREAQHRRRSVIGWSVAALVGVLAVAAVVFWPSPPTDEVAQPGATASTSPSAAPSAVAVKGCGDAPVPPPDPQTWDTAPAMALKD